MREYPHPGKFEGGLVIDEYVYQLSLEGGPDEEVGDVSNVGAWAGLMRAPLYREDDEEFQNLTEDEKAFLREQKGAIISEDGQGFVMVTYYRDEKELKQDWEDVVNELGGFEEEEEVEEE